MCPLKPLTGACRVFTKEAYDSSTATFPTVGAKSTTRTDSSVTNNRSEDRSAVFKSGKAVPVLRKKNTSSYVDSGKLLQHVQGVIILVRYEQYIIPQNIRAEREEPLSWLRVRVTAITIL